MEKRIISYLDDRFDNFGTLCKSFWVNPENRDMVDNFMYSLIYNVKEHDILDMVGNTVGQCIQRFHVGKYILDAEPFQFDYRNIALTLVSDSYETPDYPAKSSEGELVGIVDTCLAYREVGSRSFGYSYQISSPYDEVFYFESDHRLEGVEVGQAIRFTGDAVKKSSVKFRRVTKLTNVHIL